MQIWQVWNPVRPGYQKRRQEGRPDRNDHDGSVGTGLQSSAASPLRDGHIVGSPAPHRSPLNGTATGQRQKYSPIPPSGQPPDRVAHPRHLRVGQFRIQRQRQDLRRRPFARRAARGSQREAARVRRLQVHRRKVMRACRSRSRAAAPVPGHAPAHARRKDDTHAPSRASSTAPRVQSPASYAAAIARRRAFAACKSGNLTRRTAACNSSNRLFTPTTSLI